MTQKWKKIYIFLNLCICILVYVYLQYILFSSILFKREILMITVDEWALFYILLYPTCPILCILMQKWIQCSDTKMKKKNPTSTQSVSKMPCFPQFQSLNHTADKAGGSWHACRRWGVALKAFYLWLRYRGPCLGGLLLATGTKLQTSRMQKDMERKKKKTDKNGSNVKTNAQRKAN